MAVRASSLASFSRWATALAAFFVLTGCGSGGSSPATRDTFVPNYSNEIDPQTNQPNQLYHWQSFPLRVYIASDAPSAVKDATVAGLDWWVDSTARVGNYTLVNDSTAADVTVDFKDNGDNGLSGQTTYRHDSSGKMMSAAIVLNQYYLLDAKTISVVSAHEMGHALGIGGHSNTSTDVMSFSKGIFQLKALSLRDLNTIKTDYLDIFSRTASLARSGEGIQTSMIECSVR